MEKGLYHTPLEGALRQCPWIVSRRQGEEFPRELLMSVESHDRSGLLKMDQPLSSFSERRFGARFVLSKLIPFPPEVSHVSTKNPS
jgi:CRISPR system Cascade subunit CasD